LKDKDDFNWNLLTIKIYRYNYKVESKKYNQTFH